MWAVYDLETTIAAAYKRKANMFIRNEEGKYTNFVVMSGGCTLDDPAPVGLRALQDGEDKHIDFFINLLNGRKILVGQNIKFDVTYMIRHPRAHAAWREFVAGGGIVWDIQLAEYMMRGQIKSAQMMPLDEIAKAYDEDLKVDEVKLLWEAGVDTPDIDPDLLARYLLGEDLIDPATGKVTGRKEGDIGVTRNIFLKQLTQAKKLGMMRTISVNMGSLCATIEMELNGMFVDKQMGLTMAAELKAELDEVQQELNKYLPADMPIEFNWGNRYHTSPLIFGGQIKYDRREYDLKDGVTWDAPGTSTLLAEDYAYAQKDEIHYVLVDGRTMSIGEYESRLLRIPDGLSDPVPDREVFKGGKNAGEYKTKKVKVDDYTKPKSRMAEDFITLPGFTEPKPEWASETPGLYSVAADVIEDLTTNTDVPFLKTLGKVNKLAKDLGTYFISTDPKNGKQKGMLTVVGDDNIVHHRLNHTSTVTGRFSSSDPNLQNIPKGNKSKAKEMFTSRYGPDGKIVQSDFSSLEVYVQANMTKCAALVLELLRGTDMHCLRLSKKEKMPYEEVFNLCKGYTDAAGTYHPSVDEWDYKRTGVKVFSFQLAYGAGAATIAKATGMSLEDVEALMVAERELFPEIDAYFDRRGVDIERAAKPTKQFENHPANPAVRCQIMLSKIQMPTGKLYAYLSSPAPAWMLKRGTTTTFSPTERKNYEVQGEGGEIMKCAMWLAVREFYRLWDRFEGKVLLVNTVHDAMYLDACPEHAEAAALVLHACMEAATDFYCYHLGVQWDIAVPSDTVMGPSMAVENKMTRPDFREVSAKLRVALRDRYMKGFTPKYKTL